MTNDEIGAIRVRLEAATPGPWRWVRAYQCHGTHWCLENDASAAIDATIDHRLVTLSTDQDDYDDDGNAMSVGETPNFQLIAHAPADIRALLAEVERLRAALEDARRPWLNEA